MSLVDLRSVSWCVALKWIIVNLIQMPLMPYGVLVIVGDDRWRIIRFVTVLQMLDDVWFKYCKNIYLIELKWLQLKISILDFKINILLNCEIVIFWSKFKNMLHSCTVRTPDDKTIIFCFFSMHLNNDVAEMLMSCLSSLFLSQVKRMFLLNVKGHSSKLKWYLRLFQWN